MWVTLILVGIFAVIGLGSWLVTRRQRSELRQHPPDGVVRVQPGHETLPMEGPSAW